MFFVVTQLIHLTQQKSLGHGAEKTMYFIFSVNFTAVSFNIILANQNWLRGN